MGFRRKISRCMLTAPLIGVVFAITGIILISYHLSFVSPSLIWLGSNKLLQLTGIVISWAILSAFAVLFWCLIFLPSGILSLKRSHAHFISKRIDFVWYPVGALSAIFALAADNNNILKLESQFITQRIQSIRMDIAANRATLVESCDWIDENGLKIMIYTQTSREQVDFLGGVCEAQIVKEIILMRDFYGLTQGDDVGENTNVYLSCMGYLGISRIEDVLELRSYSVDINSLSYEFDLHQLAEIRLRAERYYDVTGEILNMLNPTHVYCVNSLTEVALHLKRERIENSSFGAEIPRSVWLSVFIVFLGLKLTKILVEINIGRYPDGSLDSQMDQSARLR